MNPEDMSIDFNVEESGEVFNNYLAITTSHAIEESIPGKTIRIIVREKKTRIKSWDLFDSDLLL